MDRFITKNMQEKCVIYDTKSNGVHMLNRTGKYIYSLFQAGKTIDEIEEAVRKQFAVPENQNCRKDIEDYLKAITQRELL